jgi:hypothetical protein
MFAILPCHRSVPLFLQSRCVGRHPMRRDGFKVALSCSESTGKASETVRLVLMGT